MKDLGKAIEKYGLKTIKKLTKEELKKVLENLEQDYCYLGVTTLNGLEGNWMKVIRKNVKNEDGSEIFYISNKPANLEDEARRK